MTKALESGERDAMRERYRDLDILLLDDVQFLANQPEAQEMLLGTLDALLKELPVDPDRLYVTGFGAEKKNQEHNHLLF